MTTTEKKSASRNCPLCNVAIDRCYVDDAKSGKTFFSLSSCLLPKCSADNLSWVALTTSDFSSLRLYVSLVFSLSHLKNKTRERGDSSCNVDGGGGRKKINRDRFLSQMSSISIIALRFHLRLNEKMRARSFSSSAHAQKLVEPQSRALPVRMHRPLAPIWANHIREERKGN
jgi:hypothetical protein